MMHRFPLAGAAGLALVTLAAGFTACSSTTNNASSTVAAGDGGGGTDGSPSSGDNETGTTGPGGGTIGSATIPEPTACPTAKFKTLVVLGDSISDVGAGSGPDEEPFYRTLLVKNDDAKYPDYKGFDLSTCMGIDPMTGVVKASKGGAVATVKANNTPTDMSILLNQATSLPATLTGPVLVVGTIGGNDVQRGLVTVLTGTPAQVQTQIDAFAAGFGQAMTELTKPDRFGAGVQVTVVMTNIYDPSGGTGHFYYEPMMATCSGALGLWPDKKETKSALAPWNAAMAAEAAKYPAVKLVELAAPFVDHAVSTPDPTNWFHSDCIHPNSLGQNAVRGVFWNGLVSLP